MKTRLLIIVGIVAIGMIFFSLLYIPAYLKCQSFEEALSSFDTCMLQEEKWMTCDDVDPIDNTCIIDGIKIKVAKNEN